MGLVTLAIATLMYVITAADLYLRKDLPMSLVFAAYATANLGLMYASYRAAILAAIRSWL